MRCSAASGARSTDGHAYAAAAVARGRGRAARRGLARRSTVPQARVASVRAVLGPLAARFHGEPSRAMRVLGVTGTNGKTTTTYLLEAIARAARRRARACIGTVGARIGDRDRCRPRTRRRRRPSCRRCSRAMRDAGVDDRRDGGVVARARPAPRRRHALRRGVLHEPLARPPRLPRHDRRVLRREGAAVRRRRSRDARRDHVDDPHGRALARRPRRAGLDVWTFAIDDATADVHAPRCRARRRTARRSTLVSTRDDEPRASSAHVAASDAFNVVNAARRGRDRARSAGFALDAIVAGLERADRRARAGWSGSTRARTSRCSSTTPTRPTRSSACSARPVALAGAGRRG